jgi:hypothetical protein
MGFLTEPILKTVHAELVLGRYVGFVRTLDGVGRQPIHMMIGVHLQRHRYVTLFAHHMVGDPRKLAASKARGPHEAGCLM